MTDQFCILIHYHEISLKGKNRSWFERHLIKNIKRQLTNLPFTKIQLNAARVFCFGIDQHRWDEYAYRINKIMGIKHATMMEQINCEMEIIKKSALQQLKPLEYNTFRVTTKRQYKKFPFTSQDVNEKVGEYIQTSFKKSVDLKNAEINLIIELVKGMAYVGWQRVAGHGGLPVGTSEHAISMISSGIDSPVASFEMLRRGVDLIYLHFHSMPATNRQSMQNVKEIIKVLSRFQIQAKLYSVPLLQIQQKIMSDSPNKLWVILFRRAMIKIASIIAEINNAPALVSGESVGQVASQTLSNIRATSDVSDRPILRPLCGMNKEDIVKIAQEIGTYDISIEPYDDCCSFFIPNHPETKAKLDRVRKIESNIDFGQLIDESIDKSSISTIICPDYLKDKKEELIEIDG